MGSQTSAASAGSLPRRPYGNTGVDLSVVGFGGIVVMNAEQADANRVVGEAIERGINYFDVAPAYGDAEIKLGPALEPYRKNVFLACKTGERKRGPAEEQFKRSLERMRTDHFDLYQLHAITSVEDDVDTAFAADGVMGFLLEAQKAGQIRYLGFSAHSAEAACAALDRHAFDSVLFPLNFASEFADGFGHRIVAKAREAGAACLALKAMARQLWAEGDPKREQFGKCWYEPLSDPKHAALALRWTLSQPITAALPPGEESLWRLAVDTATDFSPVSEAETEQLRQLVGTLNPIFQPA